MSENKSEDIATHDAYQTISWRYRFTKDELIQCIRKEDALEEIFDFCGEIEDMEKEMAGLSAKELLNLIIEADCHEWVLGIDYSLDAATDGSSIKTDY